MKKLLLEVKYFILDIKWRFQEEMVYVGLFHVDPMDDYYVMNKFYTEYEEYQNQKRKELGHE